MVPAARCANFLAVQLILASNTGERSEACTTYHTLMSETDLQTELV